MPSLKNPTPKICAREGCGTEFLPKHGRAKYCSKPCLWKVKNAATLAKDGGEYARQRNREYREKHKERYREHSKRNYAENGWKYKDSKQEYYYAARRDTPWTALVINAKVRAREKGLPFDLTIEWAKSKWTGFCEVSGLPLLIGKNPGKGPHPMTPSLDRIIPELGYMQSNCRIVLHSVNWFKGRMTDEEMLMIAQAIVKNFSVK